jgi:acyl carrier protein
MSQAEIEEQLKKILFEVVPQKLQANVSITQDTPLADLGITSMAKISIAFRLEQMLGIDLSNQGAAIAEIRTFGELIEFSRTLPIS